MTGHDAWDDARIGAAYDAYVSAASRPDLSAGDIRATLERPPARRILQGRTPLVAVTAVTALGIIVVGLASGLGLLGQTAVGDRLTFRDGPTPDLRTLDAGEFAFDYPADWLAYDSAAAFSGGSSIAVIGTQPVEARCGTSAHVDVNCVYEQVLEPGAIRMFIGTGAYRGATVLDRLDIENGTTTRLTVAGMPAILDEFDPRPDSYYQEDLLVHWSIGRPAAPSNVVRIEAMARDPGATEARAAFDAIIGSFRFTGPPASHPTPATEAFGLPVISVQDALALRDADVGDRELAVRGWFSPIAPIECPAPATWPVSPVEPNCPDDWIVLMSEPESLVAVTQDGAISEGRAPSGPAIRIDLNDIDTSWMPTLPDVGPAVPVELVVLGHFDDRRSALCPEAVEQQCRERMVIDRVVTVDGVQQRPAPVIQVQGMESTADAVATIVLFQARGGEILAMTVVDGETGIGRIEPSLGTGRGGFIDQRAIWVIRSLEGDRVTTYLVVDGSAAVHRMEPDGSTTRISPEPTPATPPPGDVPTVTERTVTIGEPGGPSERDVVVIDRSGTLVEARAASDPELGLLPALPIPAGTVRLVNLTDGGVLALWEGSLCDDGFVLEIDAFRAARTPDDVTLRGERGDACRLALVRWGVWLDFGTWIDVVDVTGRSLVGAIATPGALPIDSCDELTAPEPPISCSSAVRLGSQAGATVDQTRIWLTTLGAVRSSMAPVAQVVLPDDRVRVWAVVFEGRWDWESRAVDETGQALPRQRWDRWLVVVEADREARGFVYLQDWTGRPVPERL